MAFEDVVRKLVVQVHYAVNSEPLRKVDRELTNIQNKLAKMGSMQNVKQSMQGVTSMATKMTLGFAAMTAGVGFFLNEAGQFNKTQIAFETMTGSVEKGRKLLEELHAFAMKTPFTLTDVEQNASMLLGMGIATEKVIPTMKALGDVASGINRPLAMVALNYGQIRTTGVMLGTELRDFGRQGVPIVAQLSKQLKVSEDVIHKMASARQISFEMVEKAFKDMTSGTGKFANLMFKQAKTWPIMMSNFGILLKIAARRIGQELLPKAKKMLATLMDWIKINEKLISDNLVDFYKGFFDLMIRGGKFLRDMAPKVKTLVDSLGGLGRILKVVAGLMLITFGLKVANMIGTVAMGIGSMIALMTGMLPPAVAFNVALGFLPVIIGAAIVLLALLAEDINSFFTGGNSMLGELIERWSDWLTAMKDITNILTLFNPLHALINLMTTLITGKSIGTWLTEGFEAFINSSAFKKVSEFFSAIGGFFSDVAGGVKNTAQSVTEAISTAFPVTPVSSTHVPYYMRGNLASATSGALPTGSTGNTHNNNQKTTVKNDVTIEVNGAGNPDDVANSIYDKFTTEVHKDLVNNGNMNKAVKSVGE